VVLALIGIYLVPYRFRGLETIGIIVFLFNVVLYLAIWGLLITRFYLYPYTFKASFLHPTESLFVPACIVSFGTILINVSQYGPENTGYWLAKAVGILYWIDAILAVIFSAGIYLLLCVQYRSFPFHKSSLIDDVQVVNADVYYSSDDPDLDFPGISNVDYRASRWHSE